MIDAAVRSGPYASNEDWAAEGIPLAGPDSDYGVASVEAVGDTTLRVVHLDGVAGFVRFEPSAFRGIYAPLSDPTVFKQAHVGCGAVVWSDEIDIAPDNMHRHLFAFGEWVVR